MIVFNVVNGVIPSLKNKTRFVSFKHWTDIPTPESRIKRVMIMKQMLAYCWKIPRLPSVLISFCDNEYMGRLIADSLFKQNLAVKTESRRLIVTQNGRDFVRAHRMSGRDREHYEGIFFQDGQRGTKQKTKKAA